MVTELDVQLSILDALVVIINRLDEAILILQDIDSNTYGGTN